MLEERLSGFIWLHRDIPCPPEAVVDEFARRQSRRPILLLIRTSFFVRIHYSLKVKP